MISIFNRFVSLVRITNEFNLDDLIEDLSVYEFGVVQPRAEYHISEQHLRGLIRLILRQINVMLSALIFCPHEQPGP